LSSLRGRRGRGFFMGIAHLSSGGLKVTPNVLPASCRQIVRSRIVSLCRQDPGSTPIRDGPSLRSLRSLRFTNCRFQVERHFCWRPDLFAITPAGDFSVLVESDDPNLGPVTKIKRDERLAHVQMIHPG